MGIVILLYRWIGFLFLYVCERVFICAHYQFWGIICSSRCNGLGAILRFVAILIDGSFNAIRSRKHHINFCLRFYPSWSKIIALRILWRSLIVYSFGLFGFSEWSQHYKMIWQLKMMYHNHLWCRECPIKILILRIGEFVSMNQVPKSWSVTRWMLMRKNVTVSAKYTNSVAHELTRNLVMTLVPIA